MNIIWISFLKEHMFILLISRWTNCDVLRLTMLISARALEGWMGHMAGGLSSEADEELRLGCISEMTCCTVDEEGQVGHVGHVY